MKSSTLKNSEQLKLTVYWGDLLYDTIQINPGDHVRIGPDEKSKYVLNTLSPIDIISRDDSGSVQLRFNEKMQGHIRIKDQLVSLAAAREQKLVAPDASGAYATGLNPGEKANLSLGHVSFYFDWTKDIYLIPKHDDNIDKQIKSMLVPLLAFLLISTVIVFFPAEEKEPDPERIVEIISKPITQQAKAAMGERQSDDGGAQKGELGKAATKAETKPEEVAPKFQASQLSNLVAGLTSVGSSGPTAPQTEGAKAAVNQEGTGGFSTKGLAQGGGGQSMGIGRSVGQGLGGFEGTGRLGLSGNAALDKGTGHSSDTITSGGGLDRSVIDSIIRKRQDRIRLCYERQLNYFPKLAGKISIHFVIGKTGQVVENRIAEDTMKNADVSQCILSEVKDWNFPAPEGGTLVTVNYPFVFESSQR